MFYLYSTKILFLSFLTLGTFFHGTPTIAMEENTLPKSDLQAKSLYLDIFYESSEKIEDFECAVGDCALFANEFYEWLEEEYAKKDGNPKAKLIYFLTTNSWKYAVPNSEWQKLYQWLESQGDDPAALHWRGRFHEKEYDNRDPRLVLLNRDILYKAVEFYTKALEKGFCASGNSLGTLYKWWICDEEIEAKGLEGHEPEADAIRASCFKKAREYFLEGSKSQDITTYYHACKSLIRFYGSKHYYPEANPHKVVYWCIKILDILPDYFLSRLCLSDLMSENQKILRACLFPKEKVGQEWLEVFKSWESIANIANNAIILEEGKVRQEWSEACKSLKSMASDLSHKDARNAFKILYNEEAKNQEHYEKFSIVLEEADCYLPAALEEKGFTFMFPKKTILADLLFVSQDAYDPMNPAPSDELALQLYITGNEGITIAFGNENVQFCNKVMDLLEGPCSLSSLIAYHQQEIQLATTDLEIAEHTKTIDSLNNIIKSFNDMLLVVNPAKIEQFKQTYGFLADMFD